MNLSNIIFKCNIFYKNARKSDDIEILKSNINNYVHFSDSERFGISFHKDIHPGNPRGLYGIKLSKEMIDGFVSGIETSEMDQYANRKYIYIFNVNGNILDIDNVNQEEIFIKIRNFLATYYKNKISKWQYDTIRFSDFSAGNPYNKKTIWGPLAYFYQILKYENAVKNEHSFVNIVLRGIGFDGIETNNYKFEDGIKSQICILNPTSINLLNKINNPLFKEQKNE